MKAKLLTWCRIGGVFLVLAAASGVAVAESAEDHKKATVDQWLPSDKSKSEPKRAGAWVKLCDPPADSQSKPICRLSHERLDSKTANLIVSAEFWDVIGKPNEKTLFVRLMPGFAAEAGLRVGFYSVQDWARMHDKIDVDQSRLQILKIKPLLCDSVQCKGQVRLGSSIWSEIGSFAGFMVLAMQPNRQPLGFPVPLVGFNEALKGPPATGYEAVREKWISDIKRGQSP